MQVFFWNFALSFIVGNATIWKPSPTTPYVYRSRLFLFAYPSDSSSLTMMSLSLCRRSLIAIASHRIIAGVLEKHKLPAGIATLACGDVELSKALTEHSKIPLVSFTGSEKIGKIVGGTVQSRYGDRLRSRPASSTRPPDSFARRLIDWDD